MASQGYLSLSRALLAAGVPKENIFPISAVTGKGVEDLVRATRRVLKAMGDHALEYSTDALNIQEVACHPEPLATPAPPYPVMTLPWAPGQVPKKDMTQRVDDFDVTEDHRYGRCFFVTGQAIERFAQMTNFGYFEGARRFQQVLKRVGSGPLEPSQRPLDVFARMTPGSRDRANYAAFSVSEFLRDTPS